MLFSLTPKSKREDFFDREEELAKLHQLVQLYPLVVITGLRRVGKSSLVKVFLNESESPFIILDGRKVYEMSGGNISSVHLLRVLSDEFAKLSKSQKIVNVLRRIRGVSVGGNSVEIDPKEFYLSDAFEKFNRFAEKEGKFFFVFVDEAQYFRFYGARGGEELRTLFSYCHDQLPGIRILVTGSEVGVLHDFLKLDDYGSALHGRGVGFLTLKPFNFEQSVEFLRRGFEEAGITPGFNLEEIVSELDGVVGYLVLFGVKYLETRDREGALREVLSTLKALFERELSELSRRSPRYLFLLKSVAQGINTWSGLRNVLHARGDIIGDSRLYSLLEVLEKMSLIEKTPDGYKITDVVLGKMLKEGMI